MKNIITLFVLLATFSSVSFAGTNPVVKEYALLENAMIKITIADTDVNLFTLATYNGEDLEFETTKEISFIQIFNSKKELEFQLPVMSSKVTIGNSLIGKGDYKLGFMIQGSDEVHFTEITMN